METLFIADDESFIREGLKYIIDWNTLGFKICGESGNGEDTLNSILSLNPSLVLLDICMPKIQGTEIVSIARENGYKGHIIIISGFSDFKYAQEAIKHGVDFYLTKPIDEDELYQAVIKVKEAIYRNRSLDQNIAQYKAKAREVVLAELLVGKQDASQNITYDVSDDLSINSTLYQVVIYENYSPAIQSLNYNFADLLMVANQNKSFFEHINIDNKNVILLKGEFAITKFKNLIERYEILPPQKNSPLDSLFLIYGRPVNKQSEIHISYQDALALLERRFFCSQGQHTLGYHILPNAAVNPIEPTDEIIKELSTKICEYIKSFNRKKVVEALSQLEQFFIDCNCDVNTVKLGLSDLYFQIKENINFTYNQTDIPFPTNAAALEFFKKKFYLYEIIRFISEQCEMIMNATGSLSRDSVLDDVIYYIDHNYRKNIKLETIAPLFGYNSAYLGKIFSKSVRMSFNTYVDKKRIEKAKILLLQNEMKVYEIAEYVGYRNVDYFHKKFKKYIGDSPAEYRKNYSNN